MINTKENLDHYATLHHFRNALSKRSSFHETLLWASRTFKSMLLSVGDEDDEEESDDSNERRQNNSRPNKRRRRLVVDGI